MPLHPEFPESPYEIIDPSVRWTADSIQTQQINNGLLLPPLVEKIRKNVKEWRDDNYNGATE